MTLGFPCGSLRVPAGPILLTHPLGVTQKQERAKGWDSNFWRFAHKRIWVRFHEIPLFSCKTWRLEQWIWEIAWISRETCWIPLFSRWREMAEEWAKIGLGRCLSEVLQCDSGRGLLTQNGDRRQVAWWVSRISATTQGRASVACQCNMVVPTFTVKSQILKCSTTPLLLRHLYCIQKTGK